jgi:hypothetical protein
MHPIQKHLFDTNFKDLAGSKIEGTIALSEELINLGILDFINGLKADAPAKETSSTPETAPSAAMPDPKELLKLVTIDKLQVRAQNGKIMVDIKAAL